jgi:ribosomal protein S18 acetylase RimI-like enzyme
LKIYKAPSRASSPHRPTKQSKLEMRLETTFKAAEANHLALLIEMMRDFYQHDHLSFDKGAALAALRQILADESVGRVYLMLAGEEVVGYIVLTLGFSLEYHGRDAFIDEIYVKENYRGQGIGKKALQFIEEVCRELGVRALHLEVERTNTNAQAMYRRTGFAEQDSYLMTKRVD